jgi:hypothetical protein
MKQPETFIYLCNRCRERLNCKESLFSDAGGKTGRQEQARSLSVADLFIQKITRQFLIQVIFNILMPPS